MSKKAIDIIKDYLDKRAENDALFAEKYANPKKSINECWHYIVGEASKQAGDCVAMADEEVFGLAVHYYDEENIKIEEARGYKGSSASNPEEKLTEEEIQEAKEIAKERAVRRLMEEQQKMLHKPKKKKEETQSMMGDLFG